MEGPSLVILKEQLQEFIGLRIVSISGILAYEFKSLQEQILQEVLTWGKHLIIKLENANIRIHFLLFGSCTINENKGREPKLALSFDNGFINFYSVSVKHLQNSISEEYQWEVDIMSKAYDKTYILKKLKKASGIQVGDLLLDQQYFAGSGNIIKCEVLFLLHLHPEADLGNLTTSQLKKLIEEVRNYAFQFYEWKKLQMFKQHWNIYRQKYCPRCSVPVQIKKTGKSDRKSYFCGLCQYFN